MIRLLALGVAVAAVLLPPNPAAAIEPRSLSEPDVLRDPAEVTRVVDAWQDGGGMDLHFTLAYQHNWKRATILRETRLPDVAAGAGERSAVVPVARFSENTSRLNVRAELGLYHDLALILRVPIVLSNSVSLEASGLGAAALDAAPGDPLFTLPFSSPNRSGVEYLGVGVDWGILNQGRDGLSPSLLVGAEGRLSVLSEPMHACGRGAPTAAAASAPMRCTYPADINRNGVGGEYPSELGSLEGALPTEPRRAGVGRGTTGIELHAAISRRFAWLEPFLVLSASFELPVEASDFDGARPWNENPPVQGRFSLGTEIVPWELVEQFQRISFDLRLTGTYRSAGLDYSELFDALGSSAAISYRRPSFAGYRANPDESNRAAVPSVVDGGSQRVFPTGLTEVGAHGSYALRLAARWQAGQYVHFDAGGALTLIGEHLITLGRPCDASRPAAAERAGPCAPGGVYGPSASGSPDPSYRAETDQPGRRFLVDTARSIDAWVGATVMF